MTKLGSLKVAIVHDWLVGGGAERVVLELHHMFPEAPIYTSYCSPEWRRRLDGKVITGILQYWPFSKVRKLIPILRIWWFGHLRFKGYDLVISSSGAEAKAIKVPKTTLHINYCHAPTHYYWSRFEEYTHRPGWGIFDPLARLGLRLLVGPLRRWDYRAAQRPDYMIANSSYIQSQIKKYYRRDSTIIHPPIDTERFKPQKPEPKRRGFVIAGRQTPYKRTDLAVAACTKLGLPLAVIGNGPDHERLVKMAGRTVTFLTEESDADMAADFQLAQAFIFPGVDDFGVVAVEAMAAGTPVIAYQAGGALDYVTPGKTGLFFEAQTVKSLAQALRAFDASLFNPAVVSQQAQNFSAEHFSSKLKSFILRSLTHV